MKPICVPCQRFFRCIKTGFRFTEGMPNGKSSPTPPGKEHGDCWQPYKLWMGDKFQCEGCGAVIVSGFGASPVRVQHEPDFAEFHKTGFDQFQVNDC